MDHEPTLSRRSLLAVGAGGVGVVVAGGVLAACSNSGAPAKQDSGARSDSDSDHDGDNDSGQSSSSRAPAATSGAAGGAALATLDDIGVGKAVSAKLPDGKPAIVARPTSSTVVCFSAICTHQGCTVKPGATSLDCPCHGSKYDTTTGKVLNGPAPSPLPKIAVTVQGGKVVTS
ncbi:ubiquinol-cytochrome c reductase iron-sulfur subunit [uncultured Jatrophihabitans sp.]|uniref:QcrA and Rieske domain-containing protein n=1 Tax=uncultured Jatrophihabitans sp. TaxID=1610747 RepID=UPI0035CBB7F0